MKKLTLAMIAASALMLSFGTVASANYDKTLTVGATSAGQPYTATYFNCENGETITFVQPQSTPTSIPVVCVNRTATANFTAAPRTGGTYTVTATGTISPTRSQNFVIAVSTVGALPPTAGATGPAVGSGGAVPTTGSGAGLPTATTGGLPATGAGGIGATTTIAIGLLAVGLGLFGAGQVRRRQPNVA